eukprot:5864912-Amphidinium_carterae.1
MRNVGQFRYGVMAAESSSRTGYFIEFGLVSSRQEARGFARTRCSELEQKAYKYGREYFT